MAEIVVLPTRSSGFYEITRLGEELATAHARGQDLGPRARHIHANGGQRLEMSRKLELAIDHLGQNFSKLGIHYQFDDLHNLLKKV